MVVAECCLCSRTCGSPQSAPPNARVDPIAPTVEFIIAVYNYCSFDKEGLAQFAFDLCEYLGVEAHSRSQWRRQ